MRRPLIRLADWRNERLTHWLQLGWNVEELEGALLNGREFRIDHEGCVGAFRHRHGVAGDGGEIGDERLEAVDWQAVVGALSGGFAQGGFGARRLGDD